MPDVGEHDLARANDRYNERLEAAGVPDEGFAQVVGGAVHGGLFDSDDALEMAESIAGGYAAGEPVVDLLVAAQCAVHGMAVGVMAERDRWRVAARRYSAALRALGIIGKGQSTDPQRFAATVLEGFEGGGDGAAE